MESNHPKKATLSLEISYEEVKEHLLHLQQIKKRMSREQFESYKFGFNLGLLKFAKANYELELGKKMYDDIEKSKQAEET